MLPNPYTPGQVPRVLAGRDRELSLLRERLGRVSTFAEFGGALVAFHAPRGLGKTSLLRAAQRDAEASGFVTVWAAAARDSDLLAELVRSTGRSLDRTDALSAAARKTWRARLRTLKLEVGVPGAKVGAEVGFGDPAPSTPGAPIGALEDLLHDAATLVRDSGGAGLAVFLDEIHAAGPAELAVLLNALQNLDGERDRNPLVVFAAGLPSTPEALTRAATFGERSTFVALGPLDRVDTVAALTEPAAELGVGWTRPALDRVAADTAGYPYFVQLLGSTIWQTAAPEAGVRLGIREVLAGYPGAAEQLQALYRARWKAATRAEQDLIAAMADLQVEHGTEEISRGQVADRLGVPSRSLSKPRDRLIEKGVIEPAGHGLLRFTLPAFARYVRHDLAEGPPSELVRLLFPGPGRGRR